MDTEDLKATLKEALEELFDERRTEPRLDREVHAEHHAWVGAMIAKERERAEFYRTLKTKSLPAIFVTLGSLLVTFLWTDLVKFVSEHWK